MIITAYGRVKHGVLITASRGYKLIKAQCYEGDEGWWWLVTVLPDIFKPIKHFKP